MFFICIQGLRCLRKKTGGLEVFFKKLFPKQNKWHNRIYCQTVKSHIDQSTSVLVEHGLLHFNNIIIPYISGRWGKGPAPKGKYLCRELRELDKKFEDFFRFAQFDIGFFMPIEPEFESDRYALGIHPDGGIEGTLGCIGLRLGSKEEGDQFVQEVKNYFLEEDILEVEIA